MINGLAGSGAVTFTGAALARSDPTALDRVVAKAQTPDAPLDETNIAFAFGNELNRGPLAIPDGSAPLSLSAGVAKIGPIKIAEGRGEGTLTADLDLRTLAARTRLDLTSSANDLKFWSGPPPRRGGCSRKRVGGAEAAGRRQHAFRRARRPGDRARDRSHLDNGS